MKSPDAVVREWDYTNPEDRNAIGMLINAYIADEMGGGELLTPPQQSRLAEALHQRQKSIVLLACIGEIRCGLLVAFENFSTFTVCPMINIHDIIVLKEYRGKHAGRHLLEAITGIAKDRKCSRITLEVRKDNPVAKHLYKSMGFDAPLPEMYYWRKNLPVNTLRIMPNRV
ncbi:MAG: GNAT family N-acetyltransferase [Dysgonamonadaceae bacterium]|jgi:ribosomal protein S18 acetylase RimI-like enzyme|nr:GNAT family N-acetyltransferase [Dysgonamonadaceae bacterium]